MHRALLDQLVAAAWHRVHALAELPADRWTNPLIAGAALFFLVQSYLMWRPM